MRKSKNIFRLFVVLTVVANSIVLLLTLTRQTQKIDLRAETPTQLYLIMPDEEGAPFPTKTPIATIPTQPKLTDALFFAQREAPAPTKTPIATLLTTNKLTDILSLVQQGDATAIFFDIDSTLIAQVEPEAREEWFSGQIDVYKKLGYLADQAIKRFFPIHQHANSITQVSTVDKNTRAVLQELRKRNVRLCALTGRPLDMLTLTRRQFKEADINFGPIPSGWDMPFSLDGFEKPAFYIPDIHTIFAGGNNKGAIFEAFCTKTGYFPSRLIVVDNEYKNIENVVKYATKMGIPCIYGIHFTKMMAAGPDIPATSTRKPCQCPEPTIHKSLLI